LKLQIERKLCLKPQLFHHNLPLTVDTLAEQLRISGFARTNHTRPQQYEQMGWVAGRRP
jgi:hypothetical protein